MCKSWHVPASRDCEGAAASLLKGKLDGLGEVKESFIEQSANIQSAVIAMGHQDRHNQVKSDFCLCMDRRSQGTRFANRMTLRAHGYHAVHMYIMVPALDRKLQAVFYSYSMMRQMMLDWRRIGYLMMRHPS